jgi:hypothetical protein
MSHPYKVYAKPFGILLGIVILWAANWGLFLLGLKVYGALTAGDAESGG